MRLLLAILLVPIGAIFLLLARDGFRSGQLLFEPEQEPQNPQAMPGG